MATLMKSGNWARGMWVNKHISAVTVDDIFFRCDGREDG
jgi:hypothetical protein